MYVSTYTKYGCFILYNLKLYISDYSFVYIHTEIIRISICQLIHFFFNSFCLFFTNTHYEKMDN